MPALTRRKDPHRPDRWSVYFGDISVGSIGKCAGVPVHVDQWEWGCGLSTVSGRGVSAGGLGLGCNSTHYLDRGTTENWFNAYF